MPYGKIRVKSIEHLTLIVAGLTRESIVFTVTRDGDGWLIETTGY